MNLKFLENRTESFGDRGFKVLRRSPSMAGGIRLELTDLISINRVHENPGTLDVQILPLLTSEIRRL